MKLSEAMQLRDFYYTTSAYSSSKRRGWKLTGRYYYDDVVMQRNRPEDMKVEIRPSRIFFWYTKWIDFVKILPVHRFDKSDALMDVLKS